MRSCRVLKLPIKGQNQLCDILTMMQCTSSVKGQGDGKQTKDPKAPYIDNIKPNANFKWLQMSQIIASLPSCWSN